MQNLDSQIEVFVCKQILCLENVLFAYYLLSQNIVPVLLKILVVYIFMFSYINSTSRLDMSIWVEYTCRLVLYMFSFTKLPPELYSYKSHKTFHVNHMYVIYIARTVIIFLSNCL